MPDIVETAMNAGNFTTLVSALNKAGLTDALKGPGPFTVFAPTDDAFNDLPEGVLENLLRNTDQLQNILKYHVIAGRVTSDDIKDKDINTVQALNGETLNFEKTLLGVVKVNNVTITTADIVADNGVIHVINKVLLPMNLRGQRAA